MKLLPPSQNISYFKILGQSKFFSSLTKFIRYSNNIYDIKYYVPLDSLLNIFSYYIYSVS
jgi:hypothetical protein